MGPALLAHHQGRTCTARPPSRSNLYCLSTIKVGHALAANFNGRPCPVLYYISRLPNITIGPALHAHTHRCFFTAYNHLPTISIRLALDIAACPQSRSRTCTALPPFWTIIFLERNPAPCPCHRSNVKIDADMLTSLRHAGPYKITNCLLHNKTALRWRCDRPAALTWQRYNVNKTTWLNMTEQSGRSNSLTSCSTERPFRRQSGAVFIGPMAIG